MHLTSDHRYYILHHHNIKNITNNIIVVIVITNNIVVVIGITNNIITV